MSQLTCIYPVAGGNPCGITPPVLRDRRGTAYPNDLVLMQEHLRDDHLRCSADTLWAVLEQQKRHVTYGDAEIEVARWSDEIPWKKIEWALPAVGIPAGVRWLRAVREQAPEELPGDQPLPAELPRREWHIAYRGGERSLRVTDTGMGWIDGEIFVAGRFVPFTIDDPDPDAATVAQAVLELFAIDEWVTRQLEPKVIT